MTVAEMESKWQTALRKYYPGVIVREVTSIPEEDILPFLGVFMIPDDKMNDYARFSLGARWDLLESENLPDCDLLRHSVSTTREYYPHIWEEAQEELRRTHAGETTTAPKVRSRKKAAVKKSPARKTPVTSRAPRRSEPVTN